jgi:serine/threonine protein kinase
MSNVKDMSGCISEFDLGRALGRGRFGHVYLVREIKTKIVYAMKVMFKEQLLTAGIEWKTEADIHSAASTDDGQYILKLHRYFEDYARIYLILEHANNGNLFEYMCKHPNRDLAFAKRWARQLCIALAHCHENGIMHRDIKAENILLLEDPLHRTSDIRLADFGWASQADFSTVLCGTSDYVCPQKLTENAMYGAETDMWSFGVLLFEYLTGFLPFYHSVVTVTYANIESGIFDATRVKDADARDLIQQLLILDPEKRLTARSCLQHPFLAENVDS